MWKRAARYSVLAEDEAMRDVFTRFTKKVAAQVCTKYLIM
jgi:hypothetical protein